MDRRGELVKGGRRGEPSEHFRLGAECLWDSLERWDDGEVLASF
jgi:hypothetical protein